MTDSTCARSGWALASLPGDAPDSGDYPFHDAAALILQEDAAAWLPDAELVQPVPMPGWARRAG